MITPTLDHKVSVVIPAKNAGDEFAVLLEKLKSQKGVREIEIVVVDSGSTDSTAAIARKHGCKLIRIKPGEFTHSHSRNVGAGEASGDFILFMVQDASPAGERWVHALLNSLISLSSRGVVAATCREFPRVDSDLFYGFLMHEHYKFLEWREADRITHMEEERPGSLRKKGALNNIACLIRKDVFDQYKLRGCYGEDIDLGERLLRRGHKLALLSSVKVIHSHNRPPFYYLKRHFTARLHPADRSGGFSGIDPADPAGAFASVYLLFRIMDGLARKVSAFSQGICSEDLWKLVHRELAQRIATGLDKVPAAKGWHILEDQGLISFLKRFRFPSADPSHLNRLMPCVTERCRAAHEYLQPLYPLTDAWLLSETASLLLKLTASICGDYLACLSISGEGLRPHSPLMDEARAVLTEGI